MHEDDSGEIPGHVPADGLRHVEQPGFRFRRQRDWPRAECAHHGGGSCPVEGGDADPVPRPDPGYFQRRPQCRGGTGKGKRVRTGSDLAGDSGFERSDDAAAGV